MSQLLERIVSFSFVLVVCGAVVWNLTGLRESLAIHPSPSPNFDQRPPGTEIDTLVLHATERNFVEEVIRHFGNRSSGVAAHYTIDRDGTVYQHVHERYRAWHAGPSRLFDGRERVNDFSIGVELVNRNDGRDPYPSAQIRVLKRLFLELRTRYPLRHIVSHAEIALPHGRKSDPRGLDIVQLRQSLGVQ